MVLKKFFAACVDPERKEKKREEERKRAFLENGGLVVERLVAACNGRPIPIRSFSCEELLSATHLFNPDLSPFIRTVLFDGRDCKGSCNNISLGKCHLYKGSLEGRNLCIKIYGKNPSQKHFALTDLAISAKTSAHKNILKLVGCCLETPNPSLVYQYAQNGLLSDQIYVKQRGTNAMLWQSRLKIARQIAHAIAYLHTAFSRPIIHRNIKIENIFTDEHQVPKLSGFSSSLSIPDGETHVEVDDVPNDFRYVLSGGFQCPNYSRTGIVTEKVDVYSFGVVLLELLSGKPIGDLFRVLFIRDKELSVCIRNCAVNECVDPAILGEKWGTGVEQQLQAVLGLAAKCVEHDPEIRPMMVDITKELRRIEGSIA